MFFVAHLLGKNCCFVESQMLPITVCHNMLLYYSTCNLLLTVVCLVFVNGFRVDIDCCSASLLCITFRLNSNKLWWPTKGTNNFYILPHFWHDSALGFTSHKTQHCSFFRSYILLWFVVCTTPPMFQCEICSNWLSAKLKFFIIAANFFQKSAEKMFISWNVHQLSLKTY